MMMVVLSAPVSILDPNPTSYFLLTTFPLHTISGCGKREAHINCFMMTCKMAASITETTLRTTDDPVLADSRQ